jgi:hypothetical protein
MSKQRRMIKAFGLRSWSLVPLLCVAGCIARGVQNEPQQPSDSTVIVAPAELGSATHPASQSPLINAEPTAGGFSAQAQSTGLLSLQWNDIPGIRTYVVFRSTTPVFALDFKTVLTMDSRAYQRHAFLDLQPSLDCCNRARMCSCGTSCSQRMVSRRSYHTRRKSTAAENCWKFKSRNGRCMEITQAVDYKPVLIALSQ